MVTGHESTRYNTVEFDELDWLEFPDQSNAYACLSNPLLARVFSDE